MNNLTYPSRPIVTLCGSTKFKDEFEKINEQLTMKGFIVLSCGVFAHAHNISLSECDKVSLDRLHLDKIMMSDLVYVINKDGYIGVSTKNEIEFAIKIGKKIVFLENTEVKINKVNEQKKTISDWFDIILKSFIELFTPNKTKCRNCGSTNLYFNEEWFDSKISSSFKKCQCQDCGYYETEYTDL